MISLYPKQKKLYEETQNAFEFYEEVLVQAPCGFGKTVLIAEMAHGAMRNGHQSIVQAHRMELLEQISKTLTRSGVPHGWIHGDKYYDPTLPVHLSTPFSLLSRQDRVKKPSFMFEDECHHSPSKTYGKIREWLGKETLVAGFTATPQRLDGKPLADRFQYMVRGPQVSELIADGDLVPSRVYAPPIKYDTSALKKGSFDYTQKSVEAVLNRKEVVGDLVNHYLDIAPGLKGAAYCNSVDHAIAVADEFNERGIRAAALYCDMNPYERANTVEAFRDGRILVLTNYELITEGFDLPSMQVGMMARFTESLSMYIQMALRPNRSDKENGKTHAILLDHVGNCFRHGMPDQDRHWSLHHGHAQTEEATAGHKQCPECWVFLSKSAKVCHCGYDFSKPQGGKPRVFSTNKSGRLELVTEEVKTEVSRMAAFKTEWSKVKNKNDFALFLEIAKKHGYSTIAAQTRWRAMQKKRGGYVKKNS